MKPKKRYTNSRGQGLVAYTRKQYFTKLEIIQIIAHAMTTDFANLEYYTYTFIDNNPELVLVEGEDVEVEETIITGVKKHPTKKWCIEQIRILMGNLYMYEEIMDYEIPPPIQSLAIYLVEKYRLF